MEHTKQCQEAVQENAAWFKKYPKACKQCQGIGSWSSYSWQDGPDGGPCEGEWDRKRGGLCTRSCAADGVCPRCGERLVLINVSENTDPDVGKIAHGGDYGLCLHCGWNELVVHENNQLASQLEMVAPHVGHECECWMRDEPEKPEPLCTICGSGYHIAVECPDNVDPEMGHPTDEEINDMQTEYEEQDFSLLDDHVVCLLREDHLTTVSED